MALLKKVGFSKCGISGWNGKHSFSGRLDIEMGGLWKAWLIPFLHSPLSGKTLLTDFSRQVVDRFILTVSKGRQVQIRCIGNVEVGGLGCSDCGSNSEHIWEELLDGCEANLYRKHSTQKLFLEGFSTLVYPQVNSLNSESVCPVCP